MICIRSEMSIQGHVVSSAIRLAVKDLQRDLSKVISSKEPSSCSLLLKKDDSLCGQTFSLTAEKGQLILRAPDDLGFVYGIYHFSREILGIPDFWFWMDWQAARRDCIELPDDYHYVSRPFVVQNRGWFINDEVLLMGWSIDNDPLQPWRMVFETLLRCNGNMVIPGTGSDAKKHTSLAMERGLTIAQHHSEPLGAPLFSSVYPDDIPSWTRNKEKFISLWRTAVAAARSDQIIWNLGFRGQGDRPFWQDDPAFATDKARGKLISEIIAIQRKIVIQTYPNAIMCTYLYGEIMDLYAKNLISIPKDVIKVWSDNGYGRMVARRQNNSDTRINAMPRAADADRQGIYYHVSFYDLQAGNHITTLPNQPKEIAGELTQVLYNKAADYWIINASNIKPHTYYLDLIADMWRNGAPKVIEDFVEHHNQSYSATYYGDRNKQAVVESIHAYFEAAVAYGRHWDEHAGEQFWNYVPRMLVSQFMHDRASRVIDLDWLGETTSLKDQLSSYEYLCIKAVNQYEALVEFQNKRALQMSEHPRRLFEDTLLLQSRIYAYCSRGALLTCKALASGFDAEWQMAFYRAGLARREYQKARKAMDVSEHGVWTDYYRNECLTDIAQSVWVLSGLMSYLRNEGDGPHFYQWQREFTYSKSEQKVLVLLLDHNHLTDDQLFKAMLARWED